MKKCDIWTQVYMYTIALRRLVEKPSEAKKRLFRPYGIPFSPFCLRHIAQAETVRFCFWGFCRTLWGLGLRFPGVFALFSALPRVRRGLPDFATYATSAARCRPSLGLDRAFAALPDLIVRLPPLRQALAGFAALAGVARAFAASPDLIVRLSSLRQALAGFAPLCRGFLLFACRPFFTELCRLR